MLSAVWRWLIDAYHRIVAATPGGALGLLAILVVVGAIVLVLLRRRTASGQRHRRSSTGLDVSPERTATQLRAEADALAARGEWAQAVRARLRAVVRALEEQGLLDPRPGRTAAEVAAEAGRARPQLRDELWAAALTFGEIWYGGRTATASDYHLLTTVDAAVANRHPSQSRPLAPATSVPPPA